MWKRFLVLALVAAAGCFGASAPGPSVVLQAQPISAAAGVHLPPIPETVPSALGPVAVVWKDSLRNETGQTLMGGFHSIERRIYLNRAITNPVVAWQTLFHERCHLALWDTGLRIALPDVIVQQICDTFATERLADLMRERQP